MSEGSEFGNAIKGLYNKLCREEWDAMTTGMLIAFLSVIMLAWARPWGAVGAIRNWGEWILYGIGMLEDSPANWLQHSGSVIGVGFVAGAFLSANLGGDFALRIPPALEMIKAVVAGVFMGIGAALAGGCNVGGFYNAIGNLSAHGFAMMFGLIIGAIIGLKYIYWEMENISWGSGGAKTIEFPGAVQAAFALAAIAGLVWLAGSYGDEGMHVGMDRDDLIATSSGMLLIAAGLGYAMQRGRWCMIQGFREPHMTGDCKMAKSVALSIFLLAVGIAVIKFTGLRDPMHYVRGTFGWGGFVGGIVFAFGAMLAGGCGTGTLWRVGEGQIKLWIVVPFFGITNALVSSYFDSMDFEGKEAWMEEGVTNASKLGSYVYMPDTFLGYGGSLALVGLAMALWYVVATWNQESNKLVVEM
ncbi:MAG: YeeE/YedE thiosulfate transporter family protein [Desulfobulbaceae bacterium]|nr:YeeE/YedE thiosulfate transporter family protein [Desulfobulbaceae bacterium]